MTESPIAWVIGAGGLLGSAVCLELSTRAVDVYKAKVSWSSTEQAIDDIRKAAMAYSALAGGRPWRVYWCAGAGTTATALGQLNSELAILRGAMGHLKDTHAASESSEIALFLASSAGAVYAGSGNPPFTEATDAMPLSDYGRAKLEAEAVCKDFAASIGANLFIGRIANLYGPGQNLSKAQGLISVFVKAALTRESVGLYVPMETTRDYIYSQDCAAMVVKGLESTAENSGRGRNSTTKILASGQAITLKELLVRVESVLGATVPHELVDSGESVGQSADLRFASEVMMDLNSCVVTPLEQGITATYKHIHELMTLQP